MKFETVTCVCGTCGQVNKVLDIGFDSHCWSCVDMSDKLLFSIYTASVHPVVIGTWWFENKLNSDDWL